jgi:four helix bundle suffix protein
LKQWQNDHRLMKRFRELNRTPCATYNTYRKAIEHEDPAISANSMISLVKIVTYLLARQLKALEKDFINEGGLRERMTKARISNRDKI